MPNYLPLPSGSFFKAPDGMGPDEAWELAKQKHPDEFTPKVDTSGAQEGIGPSFNLGVRGMGAGIGDIWDKLTKGEGASDSIKERHKALNAKNEREVKTTSMDDVRKAYNDNSGLGALLAGAGTFADLTKETIATSLPTGIGIGAGARVGAAAAARIPIPHPLAKLAVTAVGGIGGGMLGGLPSQAEQMVSEQMSANPDAPIDTNAMMLGATAASGLDVVEIAAFFGNKLGFGKPLADVMGKLIGKGAKKTASQILEKKAATSLAAAAAKGGVRGVVSEVPIEVAQQVITRAQAGEDLLSDEAMKSYEDTAYTMLGAGAVFGMAGGTYARGQNKKLLSERRQQEAALKEAEDIKNAAAGAQMQQVQDTQAEEADALQQFAAGVDTEYERGAVEEQKAAAAAEEEAALPGQILQMYADSAALSEQKQGTEDMATLMDLSEKGKAIDAQRHLLEARARKLKIAVPNYAESSEAAAKELSRLTAARAKAVEKLRDPEVLADHGKTLTTVAAVKNADAKIQALNAQYPAAARIIKQQELLAQHETAAAERGRADTRAEYGRQAQGEQAAQAEEADALQQFATGAGRDIEGRAVDQQQIDTAEAAQRDSQNFESNADLIRSKRAGQPLVSRPDPLPRGTEDVKETPASYVVPGQMVAATPLDRYATPKEEKRVAQQNSTVGEGIITPDADVSLKIGLGNRAPVDVGTVEGAQQALPALEARVESLLARAKDRDLGSMSKKEALQGLVDDDAFPLLKSLRDRARESLSYFPRDSEERLAAEMGEGRGGPLRKQLNIPTLNKSDVAREKAYQEEVYRRESEISDALNKTNTYQGIRVDNSGPRTVANLRDALNEFKKNYETSQRNQGKVPEQTPKDHLATFKESIEGLRQGDWLEGANPVAGRNLGSKQLLDSARDSMSSYIKAFIKDVDIQRQMDGKPPLSEKDAIGVASMLKKHMSSLIDKSTKHNAKAEAQWTEIQDLKEQLKNVQKNPPKQINYDDQMRRAGVEESRGGAGNKARADSIRGDAKRDRLAISQYNIKVNALTKKIEEAGVAARKHEMLARPAAGGKEFRRDAHREAPPTGVKDTEFSGWQRIHSKIRDNLLNVPTYKQQRTLAPQPFALRDEPQTNAKGELVGQAREEERAKKQAAPRTTTFDTQEGAVGRTTQKGLTKGRGLALEKVSEALRIPNLSDELRTALQQSSDLLEANHGTVRTVSGEAKMSGYLKTLESAERKGGEAGKAAEAQLAALAEENRGVAGVADLAKTISTRLLDGRDKPFAFRDEPQTNAKGELVAPKIGSIWLPELQEALKMEAAARTDTEGLQQSLFGDDASPEALATTRSSPARWTAFTKSVEALKLRDPVMHKLMLQLDRNLTELDALVGNVSTDEALEGLRAANNPRAVSSDDVAEKATDWRAYLARTTGLRVTWEWEAQEYSPSPPMPSTEMGMALAKLTKAMASLKGVGREIRNRLKFEPIQSIIASLKFNGYDPVAKRGVSQSHVSALDAAGARLKQAQGKLSELNALIKGANYDIKEAGKNPKKDGNLKKLVQEHKAAFVAVQELQEEVDHFTELQDAEGKETLPRDKDKNVKILEAAIRTPRTAYMRGIREASKQVAILRARLAKLRHTESVDFRGAIDKQSTSIAQQIADRKWVKKNINETSKAEKALSEERDNADRIAREAEPKGIDLETVQKVSGVSVTLTGGELFAQQLDEAKKRVADVQRKVDVQETIGKQITALKELRKAAISKQGKKAISTEAAETLEEAYTNLPTPETVEDITKAINELERVDQPQDIAERKEKIKYLQSLKEEALAGAEKWGDDVSRSPTLPSDDLARVEKLEKEIAALKGSRVSLRLDAKGRFRLKNSLRKAKQALDTLETKGAPLANLEGDPVTRLRSISEIEQDDRLRKQKTEDAETVNDGGYAAAKKAFSNLLNSYVKATKKNKVPLLAQMDALVEKWGDDIVPAPTLPNAKTLSTDPKRIRKINTLKNATKKGGKAAEKAKEQLRKIYQEQSVAEAASTPNVDSGPPVTAQQEVDEFQEAVKSGYVAPTETMETTKRKRTRKGASRLVRAADAGQRSVDAGEAARVNDALQRNLPDLLKGNVTFVGTTAEIPQHMLDDMAAQGTRPEVVKGWIHSDTGEILVVGEKHANRADLEETYLHEMRHYGTDTLLGPQGMQDLSTKVFSGGLEGAHEIAQGLGVAPEIIDGIVAGEKAMHGEITENGRVAITRELLAEARAPKAANNAVMRFIKSAVAAIRSALQRMGFTTVSSTQRTTQEMFDILTKAENAVRTGSLGDYRGVGAGAARKVEAEVPDIVNDVVVGHAPSRTQQEKSSLFGLKVSAWLFDELAAVSAAVRKGAGSDAQGTKKWAQIMTWARAIQDTFHHSTNMATHGNVTVVKHADGSHTYGIDNKDGEARGLPWVMETFKNINPDADAAGRMFTFYGLTKIAKRVSWHSIQGNLTPRKKDGSSYSENEFMDGVRKFEQSLTQEQKDALDVAWSRYQQYNKGLRNLLRSTQAMPTEWLDKKDQENDYIPLYRIAADGKSTEELDLSGDDAKWRHFGDITKQPYLQELAGGDAPIMNFYESSIRNTHIIVDKALRNKAAMEVGFALESMSLTSAVGKGDGGSGDNIVRWNVEPEKKGDDGSRFAQINTEALGIPSAMVVSGLEGVSSQMPLVMKALQVPANIVRKMVTRNPMYAVRQTYSDVPSLLFPSGADINAGSLLGNLVTTWAGTNKWVKELHSMGLVGGNVYSGDMQDLERVSRMLASGGTEGLTWNKAMAILDAGAIKADAFSRAHIYSSLRKGGMGEMEAGMAVREALDFSRRGSSVSLRTMSAIMPFMNTQMQSLYGLARAMRGTMPFQEKLKIRQKFMQRGLMLTAMSLAYAATMQDDETYKNAPAGQRYYYWFINPGGSLSEPLRVRVPFEVGILFKAIPEAAYQALMTDTSTKEVAAGLATAMSNSMPFSIPPAIKPLIEQGFNVNTFTGRPLENQRMLNMDPFMRYTATTTETAKGISKLLEEVLPRSDDSVLGLTSAGIKNATSPVRIENLVNGLTTAAGMAILSSFDPIVRAMQKETTGAIEGKLSKMPIFGSAFQPSMGGAIINEMHEVINEAQSRALTFKKAIERGQLDTARELYAKYRWQIEYGAAKGEAGKLERQLNDLTKIQRQIEDAPGSTLSPAGKRKALDRIRELQIQLSQGMKRAMLQQGV